MTPINLRSPSRTLHAGVILMGGMTEILDTAPTDLIHGMTKEFAAAMPFPEEMKKQAVDIKFHWVNEKGTPASMTSGLIVQPTVRHRECSAWLSICGGMMPPLTAGALRGKTCTAPMLMLEQLKKKHPEVNWAEKRYVRDGDGKTWTSGTLVNGLDLMKAFVEHTWGGPGTLAEQVIRLGSWPVRSVEYREAE